MLRLCLLLLLASLSNPFSTAAQSTRLHTYTVGLNVFKAAILAHSPAVAPLAHSLPQGFEVYINRNSYGHDAWDALYRSPDVGVAFQYTDYLNPVLGQSMSAITYLTLPVRRFRRSMLMAGLGTGLAYHTRPYRTSPERGNILLGTSITYSMQLQIDYIYQVSERWRLSLSTKMTHYSNGGISKPNKGVNMPMLSLGVARVMGEQVPEYATSSPVFEEKLKSFYYYLGVSSGAKVLKEGSGQYIFYNAHSYVTWRRNPVSGITVGLDAFFDNALKHHIRHALNDKDTDYRRVGAIVGHQLFYRKISLITQLGVYVYRPYKAIYQPIYQRYGLRYNLTSHLAANFTLKTHGGQAETIEWGLGVVF